MSPSLLLLFHFNAWFMTSNLTQHDHDNAMTCGHSCTLKLSLWFDDVNNGGQVVSLLEREGRLFEENWVQVEDVNSDEHVLMACATVTCAGQGCMVAPRIMCADKMVRIADEGEQPAVVVNMGTLAVFTWSPLQAPREEKHRQQNIIARTNTSTSSTVSSLQLTVVRRDDCTDNSNKVALIWVPSQQQNRLITTIDSPVALYTAPTTLDVRAIVKGLFMAMASVIVWVTCKNLVLAWYGYCRRPRFSQRSSSSSSSLCSRCRRHQQQQQQREYLTSVGVDEWMEAYHVPDSPPSAASRSGWAAAVPISNSFMPSVLLSEDDGQKADEPSTTFSSTLPLPTGGMYSDVLHPSWHALMGALFDQHKNKATTNHNNDDDNQTSNLVDHGLNIINVTGASSSVEDDLGSSTSFKTPEVDVQIKKERMAIGALQCLAHIQSATVEKLNEESIGSFVSMLIQESNLIAANFQFRAKSLVKSNHHQNVVENNLGCSKEVGVEDNIVGSPAELNMLEMNV